MRAILFCIFIVCCLLNVLLPSEALCQNTIDSTSAQDTLSRQNNVPSSAVPDTSQKTGTSTLPESSATLSENTPVLSSLPSSLIEYPVLKDTTPIRPIDIRFSKYKSYNAPDSSFFNVLKIKNNTDKPIFFTPKINVPEGWNHLFLETKKMNLQSGDSAFIPIRIIIPREAKGGITYIISAQLISEEGKSITRGYSYVNIPKKSNWSVIVPNKVIYLNNLVEYEKIDIRFQNKGNGEEKLKVEIVAGKELYLLGAKDGILSFPINIPAYTDTVMSFQVKYEPTPGQTLRFFEGWLGTSMRVKASAFDTSSATSIWFKYIQSSFVNTIGKGQTPLNIMLVSRNLLTNAQPQLSAGFFGTIDFCNQRFIQYNILIPSVNRINETNISYGNYLWKHTQMLASFNTPVYKISLGDQSIGYHRGVYGRGVNGEYTFKDHLFSGGVVYNLFYPTLGATLTHTYKGQIGPLSAITSGTTYSDDTYNKIRALSVGTNMGIQLWNGHLVGIMLGASTKTHYFTASDFNNPVDPLKSFNGFAAGISYNSIIKKYIIDFNSQYYSKDYASGYTERLMASGRFGYVISKKYLANLRATHQSADPKIYIQGQLYPENKYSFNILALDFSANLTSKVTASGGPSLEFSRQTRYNSNIGSNAEFSTLSERLSARLSYHPDRFTSITPFINIGWTQVTDYNDSLYQSLSAFVVQNVGALSPYFNLSTGISIRKRMWGVSMYYYYGPYSLYSQEAFFYAGNFHRSIRIMPYYERYFLNNKLRFYTFNSYMFDPGPNVERINLNVRLDYYFNKGWSIFSNNSVSMYSRYNEDGTKYNNRSFYLDFGVKKSFNVPQPCIKFYTLKVIFFADLNGNKTMDQNEKGLPFLFAKVDKVNMADSIPQLNKEPIRFVSTELISDKNGEISYVDIPTGNYQLEILPFTYTKDLYSVLGEKIPFSIYGDLILYVPYSVSNKVIGKIEIKRDEFSSAGALSPENIRITATDTIGNSFFTLTDKDGSYVLQVPKAGTYRITTNNNVFGDDFDIEQDEFLVDFNGFKEYDVTFKFFERKRAINTSGDTSARLPGSILTGRPVNGDSSILSYPTVMDTLVSETGNAPAGVNASNVPGSPKIFFYALPVGQDVTYRVQLAASAVRISATERSKKFKGVNVQEYKEGGYYKYTSGDFTDVEQVKKYKAELRAKGYKDAFIVAFKNNQRIR